MSDGTDFTEQAWNFPLPEDSEGGTRPQVQWCQREPWDVFCVLDCAR